MKRNLPRMLAMLLAACVCPAGAPAQKVRPPVQAAADTEEFNRLLDRLRQQNPGEYEKVRLLAGKDTATALAFLRGRYGKGPQIVTTDKKSEAVSTRPPWEKLPAVAPALPARVERFEKFDTLQVGEFALDLCRRADGAFGLGEIRRGALLLRRADFLVTWQVGGAFPQFDRREEGTITLKQPSATLTFMPERRRSAGTEFSGFKIEFKCDHGPVVETASWELGGSTRPLTYFDGYRGWHAPPQWFAADAVPETNPKLLPSLLQGAGFQLEHGAAGALVSFHTNPGDRLRNASRGEALEFETTFHGAAKLERFIFTTAGDSRINLWTRSHEMVHAELRRSLGLPEWPREAWLRWPPFSRKGFRETSAECAVATKRDGFTGACIDVIWDNADFHGGKKNMNVWDYAVCEGYGGEAGLAALMAECWKHDLLVNAWVPAGHLNSGSPVWKNHPGWVMKNARGEPFSNPSGLWHGSLDSGFHDYFRDRVLGVVRKFRLDGLWMDSHLPYAQQLQPPDHTARLAALYREFTLAGARHVMVEGDASVFGAYAIGVEDDWVKEWGRMPEPELFLGSTMQAGSIEPRFYLDHFRRYTAAGAMWVMNWDFLHSPKLTGAEFDAARREVRQVVQDYRTVKDRMVHRYVHEDGSGYTWTNDRDPLHVVWLIKDAKLPDGRSGQAGKVYVVEAAR